MQTPADPSRILQLGEGFMASKTLLSAVELELFTKLSDQALTGAELATQLSLHPRAIPDFPDTLLALGLLEVTATDPTQNTATPLRPRPSWTRPARTTSAGCWTCATRGSTSSGETSPKGHGPGKPRTK